MVDNTKTEEEDLNFTDEKSTENQEDAVNQTYDPSLDDKSTDINPNFDLLMRLLEEDVANKQLGWTKAKSDKLHTVYAKHVEGQPVVLCKVYAKLPKCNLDDIFNLIMNCEVRVMWDKILKQLYVTEKISANSDIIYCEIKTPPGFSNRDYVQFRYYLHNVYNDDLVEKFKLPKSKNKYYMITLKSINKASIPLRKGIVRAETIITGYYIYEDEKSPGDLSFNMILQTDVKGKIPKLIFNKVSMSVPGMWLKNLMEGYKKLKEKKITISENFLLSTTLKTAGSPLKKPPSEEKINPEASKKQVIEESKREDVQTVQEVKKEEVKEKVQVVLEFKKEEVQEGTQEETQEAKLQKEEEAKNKIADSVENGKAQAVDGFTVNTHSESKVEKGTMSSVENIGVVNKDNIEKGPVEVSIDDEKFDNIPNGNEQVLADNELTENKDEIQEGIKQNSEVEVAAE